MSAVWIARFMRFQEPGQQEFDSLGVAVAFLAEESESGKLAGVDILAPDGSVALAGDDLDRAITDYEDALWG